MRPVFVLLAAAPALALAAPAAKLQPDAPGFNRNPSLPRWIAPLAEVPATERTTPVVTRLSETQTLLAATPVTLYNRAIQVNDSSELGKIGQSLISYFSQYQKLTLHRVMILRGSQQIDHTASVNIRPMQRETEIESGMLGGATTLQLLLNDVRIGDTLWLTYTIEGENPVMGKFWSGDYSWDSLYPVERRAITVLHPRNRPLQWRQLGDFHREKLAPKIDTQGDLVRIRFEGHAIEAVEPEPSIPASYLPVRMLQLSEYQDWQGVARWADSLFPKLPASAALKTLAKQFSQQSDAAERAATALHWVQNEIRYFSVSIGENSHRPQAPDVVLQRRYGDCKDKSYLLVSLLRELGIQAQPLLVSASTPQFPDKVLPSANWFNHVIVQISIDGKDYYVDPTRINQPEPLAALPIAFPGAQVLAVNANATQLSAIPERSETLPTFEHREEISIKDFNGAATLVSRDIYRSTYADAMRSYFSKLSANEQKKAVLSKYEKLYPGVSLQGAPNYRDVVQDNRIEITSELQLPKAVSLKDHAYHVAMSSQVLDGALDIPAKLVRNFPFAPAGGLYSGRYRLQIHWPEQVRRNDQPSQKMIDNAYFQAREEFGLRGADVDYLFDFRLKQREVPAAALPQLGEQARLLNEFVEGSLRVQESAVEKEAARKVSIRDLESLRDSYQILEITEQVRNKKDSEISADQACTFLYLQHELHEFIGPEAIQASKRMERRLNADGIAAPAECMARLWLARGNSAEALAAAQRLQEGGSADLLQRELAWADYYAGNTTAALDRMSRYRAARERGNGGMIQSADAASHIALLQRAGVALPADLEQFARDIPDGPWPRPILAMQLGLISQDDLLKQVDTMRRDLQALAREEAWFYIGQRRLADKDLAGARVAFKWVKGHGLRNQQLARQAQRELQRDLTEDKLAAAGQQAKLNKDYPRAVSYWLQGAAGGSAASQYALAMAKLGGIGTQSSISEAVQLLEQAAAQDYPEAQTMLGLLYGEGEGVKRDVPKALALLERSAAKGEAAAQQELGRRYRYGDGVDQNDARALHWLQLAADQGRDEAMAQLASMYSNGEGVETNHDLAMYWNQRSAIYDNVSAAFNIAYALENGHGAPVDYSRAMTLYRLAADRGHVTAINNIGALYENGYGVPQNYAEAIKWYRKAADRGMALSMKNLAVMYKQGRGVATDMQQAEKLFRDAAERGNAYASSQLGYIYDTVKNDVEQARLWYEKAAEQHNPTAEYNLAILYGGSRLGKPDLQKMRYWHQRAADDGDENSQFVYGRILVFGIGTKADTSLGLQYLQKAADQDNAEAQSLLGRLLMYGFGTKADPLKGHELLLKAANEGMVESMLDLGDYYESGRGGKVDYQQAVQWYAKASEHSLEGTVKLGHLLTNKNLDPARGQRLLEDADKQTSAGQYQKLAKIYADIQQRDKAVWAYERGLALTSQAGAEEDKLSHTLLQGYSKYLQDIHRHSAALPYAERSLTLAQKLLPADDDDLLEETESVCDLYQMTGQYTKSEPCYLELLRRREQLSGARSATVADLLHSISGLYQAMEQYEQAYDFARRALEINQAVNGPGLDGSERNLAVVVAEMGQYQQADKMLQALIKRLQSAPEKNQSKITSAEHLMGEIYLRWQHNEQADSLLQTALTKTQTNSPSNKDYIATLQNSLARSRIALARYADAEALLAQARQQQESAAPDDAATHDVNRFLTGRLLNHQNQYERALTKLKEVQHLRETMPIYGKCDVAEVLQEIAVSYQGLGQTDSARAALQAALDMRLAVLGAQHPHVLEIQRQLAKLNSKKI